MSHESGNFETFARAQSRAVSRRRQKPDRGQGVQHQPDQQRLHDGRRVAEFPAGQVAADSGSIDPPPGNVSLLREVTVRFNEEVTGVDADDLWLNGDPAVELSGRKSTWTFTFAPGDFGEATLSWNPAHGIADTARPPNPMDADTRGRRSGIVSSMICPDTWATVLRHREQGAG
ncbi:MAG: hypothetical protein CM1200mP34_2090 [Verrucomicrobiales bacterium]|nr:MAG: hypothetical protein CM1200mP34_2090 [Verrucomicrobiales bacterium]